jgi:MOSC domain-containing protein YiiM
MSKAKIIAVCISTEKGVQKHQVETVVLKENFGIENDAHAGDWHRQISLLADESAEQIRQKGVEIAAGAFGENLLTKGIDLPSLPVGTILKIGESRLEVTQIGKVCHTPCAISEAAGTCVMPTEGIFVRVIAGGVIRAGDLIERLE